MGRRNFCFWGYASGNGVPSPAAWRRIRPLSSRISSATSTAVNSSASMSAQGPVYSAPSRPKTPVSRNRQGMKNSTCQDREISIALTGFPMAWKNMPDTGVMPDTHRSIRNVRKHFTANSL